MTGLVLKLSPGERVLVNGAVVENGNRRSRLSILTPNANILRMRDALRPDEITTPVRRVCYIAQLVLSGDQTPQDARPQLSRGIEQLGFAFRDQQSLQHLEAALVALSQGDFYRVLKTLRMLIPQERCLLEMARQ